MRYDCPRDGRGDRRGPVAHGPEGISQHFLTDWPDGTGLWHLCRTSGRTLTCGYGFQRSHRTHSIDLRIKRRRPCHIPAIHESDRRPTTGTHGSSAWAMSRPPDSAR